MTFNSLIYLIFLPIVVLIYFVLPNKIRPYFLLIASYVFYAFSNIWLSFLILGSTLLTYLCALGIEKSENKNTKKFLLILSTTISLGLLFAFKYLNFFGQTLFNFIGLFNKNISYTTLNIILPVGISFFTFQTLSYVVDVYREDYKPVKNFFYYALFVSFFPQLVAGPIERIDHLLPQLLEEKQFHISNITKASRYLVMGYVKKIVIADMLSIFVDSVYSSLALSSGSSILLATLFFYGQIYCDFSGYCDIAKGSAYLFGIELMENFDRPYLSSSMSEFYRRWHISLGKWFKDYLYIPLGGNRKGKARQILAIFFVFFFSGLWHGASWTYVLWGLYCGFFVIFESLIKVKNRDKRIFIPLTFIAVLISWIFFRCQSVEEIGICFTRIFTSFISGNGFESFDDKFYLVFSIIAFISIPLIDKLPSLDFEKEDLNYSISTIACYSVFIILIVLASIYLNKVNKSGGFIYFQF